MLELRRADGIRGHAECFGLEQGGQAEAELQSHKHCLPCAVPYGGHEERAGQAGEDQWDPKSADDSVCTSLWTFLPGKAATSTTDAICSCLLVF